MGQPSGARIVKGLWPVCHCLAAQASALRHMAARNARLTIFLWRRGTCTSHCSGKALGAPGYRM
jgi:hypothetical protein